MRRGSMMMELMASIGAVAMVLGTGTTLVLQHQREQARTLWEDRARSAAHRILARAQSHWPRIDPAAASASFPDLLGERGWQCTCTITEDDWGIPVIRVLVRDPSGGERFRVRAVGREEEP